MKKEYYWALVVVVVLGGIWLWYQTQQDLEEPLGVPAIEKEEVIDEIKIGGNRDEHGCLTPAGYGWSEEALACVRGWELDEEARRAARLAVDHIGQQEGLTVIEVVSANCPGCFRVVFDVFQERIEVDLEDWQVKQAKE